MSWAGGADTNGRCQARTKPISIASTVSGHLHHHAPVKQRPWTLTDSNYQKSRPNMDHSSLRAVQPAILHALPSQHSPHDNHPTHPHHPHHQHSSASQPHRGIAALTPELHAAASAAAAAVA